MSVEFTAEGALATVDLCQPDKKNASTLAMRSLLAEVFEQFQHAGRPWIAE